MELLHLVATPRTGHSNTLRISNAFIEALIGKYPDLTITTMDLFHHDVPAMAGDKIEAKYLLMQGSAIKPSMTTTWTEIEGYIAGFMRADMYLISAPMWNLGIPFTLKYYIDTIVQPGYLFKYLPDGTPVGLAKGKMVIVKTSGGDYSAPPMNQFDFHEPYLKGIFGFCGIRDIHVIRAGLMDVNPDLREKSLCHAIEEQIPAVLKHL
ncbi:MAG TPA: NAD(P)H-dependent oxidoreductase [Aggregatilineales bacterium]|nr:NAD(P)H-dependent oxidoreductase [Anaerolineales bacterium]HRE46708.1 NAD(P)H-dependent oxidoreductase [Aggregatilineales bacterium]